MHASKGKENVVAWFDELDEQTQRQWRSRLEKGRLDLSASVEQTLAEGLAEEEWLDEGDEEGGGHVVDGSVGEVRRGTVVIPPRLSLQTKPMYTVASASAPASGQAPGLVPAVQPGAVQQPSQEKQHTGVFSRLAQRVTMSLAAITLPFQGQAPVAPPSTPPTQETYIPMPGLLARPNLGMQTVTTVRVERSETTTTTTIIDASSMHSPLPAPALPQASPASPVPQLPQARQMEQEEGKARLAGYATKVHLEAAPKSTPPPGVGGERVREHESGQDGERSYAPHGSTEPLALRNTFPSVPRSGPPTLELPTVVATPSVDGRQSSAGKAAPGGEAVYEMTTSGRLASVRVPEGSEIAAIPRPYFGSGSFEAGQGDIAIASPQITGASVVTVMLASDPGPVVVQYVSLQPGTGFTVHLSAPTKVKTLFNYVVLQPEGDG